MLLQRSEVMVPLRGYEEPQVERTDSGRSGLFDACRERVGALMVLAIGSLPDLLMAHVDGSKTPR